MIITEHYLDALFGDQVVVGPFFLPPTRADMSAVERGHKGWDESAFCRRGRALADRAAKHIKSGGQWQSPYSLDASTIVVENGGSRFTGRVRSSLYPDIKFELDVRVHEDGVIRVRMDEKEGLRNRYDEAASWALLGEPVLSASLKWSLGQKEAKVVYGEKDQVEVTVEFEPLVVRMKRSGKDQVVLNGQGLLHMEHSRDEVKGMIGKVGEIFVVKSDVKEDLPLSQRSWFEGDTEDGFWEESWVLGADTKPKGDLGDRGSVCRVFDLIPVQVPSLIPSILTSLTTATSTVSPSMLPA